MKLRNGFVSNSSSSSFVILGTKMTAAERKAYQKALEAADYDDRKVLPKDLATADEDVYIGIRSTLDVEDGGTDKLFSRKDFDKAEALLKDYLKRDVEVYVYAGTEYC